MDKNHKTAIRSQNSRPSSAGGPEENKTPHAIQIVSLLLFALIIALYYVLRYAGHWTENDTAALTQAIRAIFQSGQLVPETGTLYPHGYGFQTISVFNLNVTGLDPNTLQQWIHPLAIILLVPAAWVLLREISGSQRSATLGTILLLSQPEILFAVLRGSHEKFGRLFLVLALFLLFRSFRSEIKSRHFAIWVGLFYLSVYGLIASNFLFGTSFVSAIVFAFLVGAVLERIRFGRLGFVSTTTQRFMLLSLACFLLAFLFAFYAYPPAQSMLRVMNNIAERTRALFLESESSANVYQGILAAWNSPVVYTMVNLGNLTVILVSFSIWVWQSTSWLLGANKPGRRITWLLWLLYGAFGFQAALSVISDASGLFGNLQHRVFPALALLGVAMITENINGWIAKFSRPRLMRAVSSLAVLALVGLAMLKATNEASLVGYWTFYTEPEFQTVQWFDDHADRSSVWVGYSARLDNINSQLRGESKADNRLDPSDVEPTTTYFMLSDMILHESARSGTPLPGVSQELLIYDSGTTNLYHVRPRTPFQR